MGADDDRAVDDEPKPVRTLSYSSLSVLNELAEHQATLESFEASFATIQGSLSLAGLRAAKVGGLRDACAQLNGQVDRLQMSKIDQVMVGNLNSGKEIAREQRKTLTARAELLTNRISD